VHCAFQFNLCGHAQVPGLAVVIVGERKDSQTYVRMKKKACEEVGIASFGADLPATATQQEVLDVVAKLNADPEVHGILVQLPVSAAQVLAAPRPQLTNHGLCAGHSRACASCCVRTHMAPCQAHVAAPVSHVQGVGWPALHHAHDGLCTYSTQCAAA
jgi:hypothetical protein